MDSTFWASKPGQRPRLGEERTRLRAELADCTFCPALSAENPEFLDALLRLSPEAFFGYFDYGALPWRTGALWPI